MSALSPLAIFFFHTNPKSDYVFRDMKDPTPKKIIENYQLRLIIFCIFQVTFYFLYNLETGITEKTAPKREIVFPLFRKYTLKI
jgi:hypothetical protein